MAQNVILMAQKCSQKDRMVKVNAGIQRNGDLWLPLSTQGAWGSAHRET